MLVQCGHCQKGRNGHMVFIHSPVRQDHNVYPVPVGTIHLHKQSVNGLFQTGVFIIGNGDHFDLKAVGLHTLDLHQICIG